MHKYKNDHAMGKAMFGGVQGALFKLAYHASGLNKPPKPNTNRQINIKPTKLNQLLRRLGVILFTFSRCIVRVGIQMRAVRIACD